MMTKVVDDGDAAGDAFDLHPLLDAAERFECILNLLVFESDVLRGGDDCERVAHVQLADHVDVKLKTRNLELRGGRPETQIKAANRVVLAEAKTFQRAMRDV